TRHVAASIEMLMEPLVGRRHHGAFMPWANNLLFALFPHDRIAFARRNDNRTAWTMAVRLLIGLGRKHRHVRCQLGVRKLHKDTLPASATALVGVELVPSAHIGKKVAVPERAHAETFIGILRLN